MTRLTRNIAPERIGVQAFTVRSLLEETSLGLEATMALIADAGATLIEIGGDYLGRSAREFREVVESQGLSLIGNHFGPRTLDGHNKWYSEERSDYFDEADALGLTYVGTGHYYNVPLTPEGFTTFAQNLNIWGEETAKRGFKFYYHNHDGEFARFDNKPIFQILLENTDPSLVSFELDLGWAGVAGEDLGQMVKEHQHRFPIFHVKDVVWRDDGVRSAQAGTLNAGRRFDFANVGQGEIDWHSILGGLKDLDAHRYLVEHDDAGLVAADPATSRKAANPAGPANTIWQSAKYLRTVGVIQTSR